MKDIYPVVSIIIPAHNEQEHLPRCLDSAINQTYTPMQVIVVDDASADKTRAIIKNYASSDERIIPIYLDVNLGQGEARNAGLDRATGNYIFFLDADDYLPAGSLKVLTEIALEHDSDIVYGKTASRVDVDGRYIKDELRNITLSEHPDLLYNHSVWNKLVKRELLESKNIRFQPPRYAEDVIFALKCNYFARSISITTETTYIYHWARQVRKVTKQKVMDGRECIRAAHELICESGDRSLEFRMAQKTAQLSYATMVRAEKVFDDVEIIGHLEWWRSLLNTLPEEAVKQLPEKSKIFVEYVLGGKFEDALEYRKTAESLRNRISQRIFRPLLRLIKPGATFL